MKQYRPGEPFERPEAVLYWMEARGVWYYRDTIGSEWNGPWLGHRPIAMDAPNLYATAIPVEDEPAADNPEPCAWNAPGVGPPVGMKYCGKCGDLVDRGTYSEPRDKADNPAQAADVMSSSTYTDLQEARRLMEAMVDEHCLRAGHFQAIEEARRFLGNPKEKK